MRLDLFLRTSRLCLRRTLAQRLCELDLVSVNGSPAKAAHPVKPGDEITVRRHDRFIRIRVVALPTTRQISRKEASALYELLDEESLSAEDA